MTVSASKDVPSGGRSATFEHQLRWRVALADPVIEIDLGLSGLEDEHLTAMGPRLDMALAAMRALEEGGIANPSEQRMVGHYWLRAPGRAPSAEIADGIAAALRDVEEFAAAVHAGEIAPPDAGAFRKVLLIGIGGSALGPMLLADALGASDAPLAVHVLDNTDPDGIDRTFERLQGFEDTLVVVASKSGGTPETRNGMLEVQHACRRQGLDFAARAVAVTSPGSALDALAREEGWLRTFPIQEWVGGRTSVTSPVGLLPAALLGADVRAFLAGAAAMDELTRGADLHQNPAALLALHWHEQGHGRGERAMVVLPYRDRLLLLSRYLQQLVMESLGKRQDRDGVEVHQGLSVFGNKGSTDQHAYVQQLRDGRHDFFVLFVRVLRDRDPAAAVEIDPGVTSGDWLDGFLLGTRQALYEAGRDSVTITLERLGERSLGALIALFERAVGLYAELINVNAYDQPGVEAGKKAAGGVLALQQRVLAQLRPEPRTCVEVARELQADPSFVWPILRHLAANRRGVRMSGPVDPLAATFSRQ